MQKKHHFRSGILLTGLFCSAILLCGCAKKEKKSRGEREVRVNVQKLEKRTFRRQIPVQGTVDPVQFAVLSAKLGGTIERFPAETGMKLKKGDVLYEIDRQILKNQVTMRKDEIEVKRSEVKTADARRHLPFICLLITRPCLRRGCSPRLRIPDGKPYDPACPSRRYGTSWCCRTT